MVFSYRSQKCLVHCGWPAGRGLYGAITSAQKQAHSGAHARRRADEGAERVSRERESEQQADETARPAIIAVGSPDSGTEGSLRPSKTMRSIVGQLILH